MGCFKPITAYLCANGSVVFQELSRHDTTQQLALSCGQCVGCRLERSRQWAVRVVHEASLHDENCFITLTYDDGHLPVDQSLKYRDFQLFMKRLRKQVGAVRFYMCGEYGELNQRPHYHACLFGFRFSDLVVFRKLSDGYLYTSKMLERLWPHGFCTVGDVTFESAAYVARYLMKKITGEMAESHYRVTDYSTGEIRYRVPEFTRMSLRPGIGFDWLRLYWQDLSDGKVVVRGKECMLPRYYRKYLKRTQIAEDVKQGLYQYAQDHAFDLNDPGRVAARKAVLESRLKLSKRSL